MKSWVSILLVVASLAMAMLLAVPLNRNAELLAPAIERSETSEATPPPAMIRNYIQLSSHSTKDEAKRAVKVHEKNLQALVGKGNLETYRVTISGKDWYRIVMPMKDRETAEKECSRIRSSGGDCLVLSF